MIKTALVYFLTLSVWASDVLIPTGFSDIAAESGIWKDWAQGMVNQNNVIVGFYVESFNLAHYRKNGPEGDCGPTYISIFQNKRFMGQVGDRLWTEMKTKELPKLKTLFNDNNPIAKKIMDDAANRGSDKGSTITARPPAFIEESQGVHWYEVILLNDYDVNVGEMKVQRVEYVSQLYFLKGGKLYTVSIYRLLTGISDLEIIRSIRNGILSENNID